MLPLVLVFLLVMIVASRPFFWGTDSKAGKSMATRILATAPEPEPDEWSRFIRMLVIRDRTVVVGSLLAVAVVSLFWNEIPSDWVVLNAETTFMLLAVGAVQPVSAAILSICGVIGLASRKSDRSVARLSRVGVLDYAPRTMVWFPLVLLVVSAVVNIALALPVVKERADQDQVPVSSFVFVCCALVLVAALTLAAVLVRRGSISHTTFGVFAADLVRLEAVRSLFALAAGVATFSFLAASFAMTVPIAALGGDAASAVAVLWMCVIVAIYIVLFRMTFRPTRPELMKRLWGAEREDAQDA